MLGTCIRVDRRKHRFLVMDLTQNSDHYTLYVREVGKQICNLKKRIGYDGWSCWAMSGHLCIVVA